MASPMLHYHIHRTVAAFFAAAFWRRQLYSSNRGRFQPFCGPLWDLCLVKILTLAVLKLIFVPAYSLRNFNPHLYPLTYQIWETL